ncbi:MAG: autotransporter adhesin family protein [Candidatus Bathyarchaeota archaeon]|nr:autotransporter adhesin family protein [Candidatus Termiticorpusculum sp.]
MAVGFCVSRRSLLLVSLLVVVLFSSLFACMFVNDSSAASLENAVHVKSEEELKNAMDNAPTGKSTIIALDNDITLTSTTDDHNSNYYPVSIIIPADKDITLTSNKASGYYKLNGAVNGTILHIVPNGVLRIDGVGVIHTSNTGGGGVCVYTFAEFYLYGGIISTNKAYGGHGVTNYGLFVMSGGEITGNTDENGGGVWNSGTFSMSGGTISGNNAADYGGGVHNAYRGVFTMSGGIISDNTADYGGGVHLVYSEFTMSGGTISSNTATQWGGGVYNGDTFIMAGGKIIDNAAKLGGGVYNSHDFTMSGGTISSNTADHGGGVYNEPYPSLTVFNRLGGVISDNTATNSYNDVYSDNSADGLANGNNGSSSEGFSLRNFLITCVLTAVVAMCIVLVVLTFRLKKD